MDEGKKPRFEDKKGEIFFLSGFKEKEDKINLPNEERVCNDLGAGGDEFGKNDNGEKRKKRGEEVESLEC